MPDPVCVQNSSSAIPSFDCEAFEITGEASPMGPPPPPTAPAAATPSETGNSPAPHPQAVNGLVKVVIGRVELPPEEAPRLSHPERCLGEADSLAIALIGGAKNLLLGFLTGLKVGHDVSKCDAKEGAAEANEIAERKAEQYCVEDGGTPREWSGRKLECVYPQERLGQ